VDEFVDYINKKFNLAFLFDYEMYNPNDRFGQLMVKNFDLRGCPLIGMHKYPDLGNQHERYTKAGFKHTEVYTMLQMYPSTYPVTTTALIRAKGIKSRSWRCWTSWRSGTSSWHTTSAS
jgi:hypothetical protein